MSTLVVADHPLIAHKLSLMRDKATPSAQFRHLLREVSLLLGYELLRDLPTELRDIETPVGPARVPFLKGKKLRKRQGKAKVTAKKKRRSPRGK